jgi:hypothetical protein
MSSRQITAAVPAANLAAALATAQIFAALQSGTIPAPALLSVPGGPYRMEAKRFVVRMSGAFTGSASGVTANPVIMVGNSLTPGSNTVIAQGTATTIGAGTCPYWLEAQLIYDSLSGRLTGYFSGSENNTVIPDTALAGTAVTGLSSKNDPVFQLVCGVTFSTASTANVASLSEFVLET